MSGIKVYWKLPGGMTNTKHDEEVADTISKAQTYLGDSGLSYGIGVIDFADCTVIVATDKIPPREVFVTQRPNENSILHGGFND